MITGFTFTQYRLIWRTDSAGNWRKEYKLFDHLGSVRTVLRKGLADNSYEYREQISYNPFGEVRERQYCTDNATPDARLKYIGKQLDNEMNLADHGVRKYDNILGQFTSIDPMWEKYYGWTPYQYCGNNPLSFVDPSGFFGDQLHRDITGWAIGTKTLWGMALADCNKFSDRRNAINNPVHHAQAPLNKVFIYIAKNLNSTAAYKVGSALHTLQDLYAHTNYVEFAVTYFGSYNIPTITEARSNLDFMKAWSQNDNYFESAILGALGGEHDKKNLDSHDAAMKNYGVIKGTIYYIIAERLAIKDTRDTVKRWAETNSISFEMTPDKH